MDASNFSKQFYSHLGPLSKGFGMKYSKGAFSLYQRLGDVFWRTELLCGFFLRDGRLEVTAVSRVKPLSFDEVQFAVIDPGKTHRVTDAQRVAAAFAARALLIGKTVCRLPCAGSAQIEEEQVRAMLLGIIKERDDFLGSAALGRGLSAYLMEHWEKYPYEAGLAHLCQKDWSAAARCFRLAGEKGCFEQKSIGRPGRYLHLVFIDYCRAMLSGVEWRSELAENGFSG